MKYLYTVLIIQNTFEQFFERIPHPIQKHKGTILNVWNSRFEDNTCVFKNHKWLASVWWYIIDDIIDIIDIGCVASPVFYIYNYHAW